MIYKSWCSYCSRKYSDNRWLKIEGDTMSGEAQLGDFGTMEWTAKKK